MTQPTPGDDAMPERPDAAQEIDPMIAALYRPPFQPGELQLPLSIRIDVDMLWAEIPGMPGMFATGRSIPELGTALGEAVERYVLEHTTIVAADPTATEED